VCTRDTDNAAAVAHNVPEDERGSAPGGPQATIRERTVRPRVYPRTSRRADQYAAPAQPIHVDARVLRAAAGAGPVPAATSVAGAFGPTLVLDNAANDTASTVLIDAPAVAVA
jgi:hypothetical protein